MMNAICETCIQQSPAIAPMWMMFPHKEATCRYCGKVKECVVVPVGGRMGAANPFPERTNEELLQDVYVLLIETCNALESKEYEAIDMTLRLNLTGGLAMAGIKLEKVMTNLNLAIPE